MFESLQNGLKAALKTIQGKAKLTEGNMRDGLKLVEQSLLEADVSYSVVQEFMANVVAKATGEKVLLSLDPSQQVVGIVHEQLLQLLGPVDPSLHLTRDVNVLMLCGLQGAGKTTTCGKLARLIKENDRQCMLVAADLQRPAAIQQLHVLGEQLGIPVYSEPGAQDPVKVCQNAVRKAKEQQIPVVILDTAGRLAIDEVLMAELQRVERQVQPDQVYLVVDGMTGQDAVNSAQAFNKALELDGVIMTKLDGDARGGALLSVKFVTGVPIKFIGTGEHLDALEPFRPEGMASRILGMGDIVGLVDVARRAVDEQKQKELEEKLRAGEFTLDDFKTQLEQLIKPGLMQKLMGMIPGMSEMTGMMGDVDAEGDAKRLVGIINSMTPAERRNPKLIDPSRRNRIARGAGVEPQEISALLKQYDFMAPMMRQMAGEGLMGRLKKVRELQEGGMLNPGARLMREKKGTGKRLTSKEKADLRKQREKELRRRKRLGRDDEGS
ncbi:MAG TPA: signal recognition particle protein [Pirellulaceae bacterium]|nr:signal recognition particle protein [Pirellulaceae bacterium]